MPTLYTQSKLADYADALFNAVKVPTATVSAINTKYSKAALTTALANWWASLTTQEQTDLETAWAAMDPSAPKLTISGTFATTTSFALDDTFTWRFLNEDDDERYTEIRQIIGGNDTLIVQTDMHDCPIVDVSLDTARENLTLTSWLASQPEPQVPSIVPVVVSQSSTWVDIMSDLTNLPAGMTPALFFKAQITGVNDPVSLDTDFEDFEEAAEQRGLKVLFADRNLGVIDVQRFVNALESWLVRNP
jgi:hypothetical protein